MTMPAISPLFNPEELGGFVSPVWLATIHVSEVGVRAKVGVLVETEERAVVINLVEAEGRAEVVVLVITVEVKTVIVGSPSASATTWPCPSSQQVRFWEPQQ